ncbi:GerAB/ArcD/ProY family transporter [Virgibacillus sp. SK37]|uniref:GerAB/ArcD/ProY family transporter n=1 Tax=Virgibacillus sp. SK37 TaxID=403957 RepID=UPI0004D1E621|nr:GerAB/ArcD/ProY family transporter [Virgibacillus sp. SK37]AIF42661.1 spore germination protein [Virgibacillus sp. SK37]
MDINNTVPSYIKIRAFYLFFIITTMQLGVGIMGAPSHIFHFAKQDSWISILIGGVYILLTVSVMIFILKQYENADIFGIQVDVFGKWIGKLLGSLYVLYFGFALITVLVTYIEVIQIFLHPTLATYLPAILIMLLIVYAVLGGVRIIVGVCFLFFIFTQWILLLLYDPISRMDWTQFLPMFVTPLPDLLQGAKGSIFTLGGFEILFLIYPFIQNKEKIKLPVFLGIGYSVLILLLTTIISIGYFGLQGLGDIEFSVLSFFKSVSFSFVERVDYLVVMEWLMIVLPNNILVMWGITYGMKRLYRIPQKTTLYIVAVITIVTVSFIKYDYVILKMTDIVSNFGLWLVYVYPYILLPLVLLKKRTKKGKGVAKP